jgi:glycerol-3-phosphate dehydrogenase
LIVRDPGAAAERRYDLLVIGGGIYGACLLQEAAARGLSACLCEAQDFGGGTSWNSLRILHGGFRYLQTLDLARYRQSLAAVRQWQAQFPGLVEPLECLLPLDGRGFYRPGVLRAAAKVEKMLGSAGGGAGVLAPSERPDLPDSFRVAARFGIASWHDKVMVSSERIHMELIRDACRRGAMALNRVRVDGLIPGPRAVLGVRVTDLLAGRTMDIRADRVVDCSGPYGGPLANARPRVLPDGRHSLALNVLLDLRLPGRSALAVRSRRKGSQVLFLVPRGSVTLAGTLHCPPTEHVTATPRQADVQMLVSLLDEALPGAGIADARILRVLAGMLPAASRARLHLQTRPSIIDHARAGGPEGLWSVRGTKYTLANVVAKEVLDRMGVLDTHGRAVNPAEMSSASQTLIDPCVISGLGQAQVVHDLEQTVREESVLYADDLVLRRSGWALSAMNLDTLRSAAIRAGALSG